MYEETRFCVQPYVLRGRALVAADVERYREPDDAMAAAERMRRRVAGVAVFKVTGWPMQDAWRDPVVLARIGETPADLAA